MIPVNSSDAPDRLITQQDIQMIQAIFQCFGQKLFNLTYAVLVGKIYPKSLFFFNFNSRNGLKVRNGMKNIKLKSWKNLFRSSAVFPKIGQ